MRQCDIERYMRKRKKNARERERQKNKAYAHSRIYLLQSDSNVRAYNNIITTKLSSSSSSSFSIDFHGCSIIYLNISLTRISSILSIFLSIPFDFFFPFSLSIGNMTKQPKFVVHCAATV